MAKAFRRRGLTSKQVALTLLVTLLVGGGVSALQSWNSLDAERAAAQARMTLLTAAARDNAAAAAFRLDRDLAGYVAEGLASSTVIAEAVILDENGAELAAHVERADATAPAWLVELAYGDLAATEEFLFGLERPGLRVGTLRVVPDRNALAAEFVAALRTLVVIDLAKSVVLAIVLSLLFFTALTRPLLRLAESVRRATPGRDERLEDVEALRAHDDEFARLVGAFDDQLDLFRRLLDERGTLLDELRLRNAALGSMDSAVAIIASDRPERPIVDANGAMATLLGERIEDLVGRSLLDCFDPEARSKAEYEILRAFVEAGMTEGAAAGVFELFAADGRSQWGKVSISPIPDDTGRFTHRVLIIHDITEARETEEKLRHSQKMDALGKVAGGIAHDFNNMLAIMQGNLEIAGLDFEDHPEFLESLQPISRSVDRAAELTRRLLRFSRTTPIQEHVVGVDESIRQMKDLLRSSLTPGIGIEFDLTAPDALVRLDKGDLEDALLNLAVNARDAMADGGSLTFATRRVELAADAEDLAEGMRPGTWIRLSVTDTGIGMDERTMKRVFEPFFTTKGELSGTGLGLSQVYGFVERSGGHVDVRSRPGEGTTFVLYLPVETGVATDAGGPVVRGELARGDETILVVDDEAELLEAARKILERLGYTAITTSEPARAIELFRERRGEIDLLLSDVVMPGGMNGHELAEALREIDPDLPVLMVSGYDSRRSAGHSPSPLLAKPYSAEQLARAIRSSLDRGRTTTR